MIQFDADKHKVDSVVKSWIRRLDNGNVDMLTQAEQLELKSMLIELLDWRNDAVFKEVHDND